jgi:SAM-dependent methyltransferase
MFKMMDSRDKEVKKKKFAYWQSFDYGKWFEDDRGSVIDAMERSSISRFMKSKKIALTLDVGIGNGRLLDTYCNNSRGIIGLDFSQKLVSQSKLFAEKENIKYQCVIADATHLPFKNKSFDLIICTRVLQHIPHGERKVAIGEMVRVSKSKGTVLLMLYNVLSLFGMAKLILRATTKDYSRHSKFNTIFDISRMLKMLGVTRVRTEGVVFFPIEFLKKVPNVRLRIFLLNIGTLVEKLVVYFPFKFFGGRLIIEGKTEKVKLNNHMGVSCYIENKLRRVL